MERRREGWEEKQRKKWHQKVRVKGHHRGGGEKKTRQHRKKDKEEKYDRT